MDSAAQENDGEEATQATESTRDAARTGKTFLARTGEGERYLEDVVSEACTIPSGQSAGPNPARVLVERPVRVSRENRNSESPAGGSVFS